jgi:peroxiredoxin
MTNATIALLLIGLLAAPAAAQNAPDRIDVERLGPQVGQAVPEFRLMDQRGRMTSRDDIMGPNGAMIVFSRSLDWCPYCRTQAIELQGRVEELRAQGLGLALITYDTPAVMTDFAKRRGITYPLLSDPGSATIRRYGILNSTVTDRSSRSYGIPFPGSFIVNRQGVVTARFFEEAYQERNTIASILLKLGTDSPVAGTRVTTDHLQLVTYASDEIVAPGTLFSLVFDITPRERMHVYAPGADNYKVIGVTLAPNPLLNVRPLDYPESEIYFFEPLDERVPAYMKPFRLTQTLAFDASPQNRAALAELDEVTIEGSLDYQACDDRICFVPRSIPVSYTVRLRALDR